uniref:C2H2-type domain-containing protein n=1 Tax=Lygus hesperus TaxID=30085 RepID=A0A0A9XV83_LYGHE
MYQYPCSSTMDVLFELNTATAPSFLNNTTRQLSNEPLYVAQYVQGPEHLSYTANIPTNTILTNSVDGPQIPHMYAKLRRSKRLGEPSITSLRRNSISGKKFQEKSNVRKNTQHNSDLSPIKKDSWNSVTSGSETSKHRSGEGKFAIYLCHICGKDFDKSSGLKRHVKVCVYKYSP